MSEQLSGEAATRELPEWVRSAIANGMVEASPEPSHAISRENPAWPLLVDAAVVSSFLPRDLGDGADLGVPRREAEREVLEVSEVTRVPGGTRWNLKRSIRRVVLEVAIATGDLRDALERTRKLLDDANAAMRACLDGSWHQAEPLSAEQLELRRAAVAELADIPELKLPSLEALDREIELRRLLEQFERMIDRRTAADGTVEDRFFGREAEIRELRSYVDALEAESRTEYVQRAAKRIANTFGRRRTMVVTGIGGVGKTTLIAKFMLDHARAAGTGYPFAYIDFDRAAISARNPAGLLVEMALQVGAQVEPLSGEMLGLRNDVRAWRAIVEASADTSPIAGIAVFARRFRKLVDDYLATFEHALSFSRPFLLVLDTFEVVEYSKLHQANIEKFIRAFSEYGESVWPRLRLIVAGRSAVESFLDGVTTLPLDTLTRKGSAELLVALAGDHGIKLSEEGAMRLIAPVAALTRSKNGGLQPLRLRLLGEVIGQTKRRNIDLGDAALVDEVEEFLASPEIGVAWYDGILVRRILRHIVDPRVRALADPGLIVRRITPEVIRHVMARGTRKPDEIELDQREPDSTDFATWEVTDAEAHSIFEAFAEERTLIERDGAALRHRQDVRREMLPLISQRRPRRFLNLHRLAFEFFAGKATIDPRAAAEAIYHGLWSRIDLESLDRLWPSTPSFDPAIDPTEFETGSPANAYLRAKRGEPMADYEVARLPMAVARDWCRRRMPAFLDEPATRALATFRVIGGRDLDAIANEPQLAAGVCRITYRAGLWREAHGLAERFLVRLPDTRNPAVISLARTASTIAGKVGESAQNVELALRHARSIQDPLISFELFAHATIGQLAASGNLTDSVENRMDFVGDPTDSVRHEAVMAAGRVHPEQWRGEMRLLRLAVLMNLPGFAWLVPLYIESSDRLPRDEDVQPIINELLRMVAGDRVLVWPKRSASTADARKQLEAFDREWHERRHPLSEALREDRGFDADLRRIIAFDHRDWRLPFANSLERCLEIDEGGLVMQLVNQLSLDTGFRTSLSNDRAVASLDAIDAALDTGRLLTLARELTLLESDFKKRNIARDRYDLEAGRRHLPQDLFGLARCLLGWHARLCNVGAIRYA